MFAEFIAQTCSIFHHVKKVPFKWSTAFWCPDGWVLKLGGNSLTVGTRPSADAVQTSICHFIIRTTVLSESSLGLMGYSLHLIMSLTMMGNAFRVK